MSEIPVPNDKAKAPDTTLSNRMKGLNAQGQHSDAMRAFYFAYDPQLTLDTYLRSEQLVTPTLGEAFQQFTALTATGNYDGAAKLVSRHAIMSALKVHPETLGDFLRVGGLHSLKSRHLFAAQSGLKNVAREELKRAAEIHRSIGANDKLALDVAAGGWLDLLTLNNQDLSYKVAERLANLENAEGIPYIDYLALTCAAVNGSITSKEFKPLAEKVAEQDIADWRRKMAKQLGSMSCTTTRAMHIGQKMLTREATLRAPLWGSPEPAPEVKTKVFETLTELAEQ